MIFSLRTLVFSYIYYSHSVYLIVSSLSSSCAPLGAKYYFLYVFSALLFIFLLFSICTQPDMLWVLSSRQCSQTLTTIYACAAQVRSERIAFSILFLHFLTSFYRARLVLLGIFLVASSLFLTWLPDSIWEYFPICIRDIFPHFLHRDRFFFTCGSLSVLPKKSRVTSVVRALVHMKLHSYVLTLNRSVMLSAKMFSHSDILACKHEINEFPVEFRFLYVVYQLF